VGTYCYVPVRRGRLGGGRRFGAHRGAGAYSGGSRTACYNYFHDYRQDAAKRQTAGIKFTQAKNQFFAPQGRLVAPIHVKAWHGCQAPGPLGCAKLHLNRLRGWESGRQNIKNFHFLAKSRLAGANPLTDF